MSGAGQGAIRLREACPSRSPRAPSEAQRRRPLLDLGMHGAGADDDDAVEQVRLPRSRATSRRAGRPRSCRRASGNPRSVLASGSSGATCVRRWPPRRTRSIAVLVRKIETLRPAVSPPFAIVKATDDSSDSMPLVTRTTSFSVPACIVVSRGGLRCMAQPSRTERGAASLAGSPKDMIENPDRPRNRGRSLGRAADHQAVRDPCSSASCRRVHGRPTPSHRLGGSGASASATMPFHILVEGSCWLRMDGQAGRSRGGRCRRVSVRHAARSWRRRGRPDRHTRPEIFRRSRGGKSRSLRYGDELASGCGCSAAICNATR